MVAGRQAAAVALVAGARHPIHLRPSAAAVVSMAAGSRAAEESLRLRHQPPPATGCATPDPFASIGGGACVNGGWTPRTSSCTTPDPFASIGGGTCVNGGWTPGRTTCPHYTDCGRRLHAQLIPSRQLVVAPVRMEVGSRGMPAARPRTHSRASAVACARAAAGDLARSRRRRHLLRRSRCDVGSFHSCEMDSGSRAPKEVSFGQRPQLIARPAELTHRVSRARRRASAMRPARRSPAW